MCIWTIRILTNIYLHLYIYLIHYATSATTIEKNIYPFPRTWAILILVVSLIQTWNLSYNNDALYQKHFQIDLTLWHTPGEHVSSKINVRT
jgi:hypothetical protein